jgi:hypothetical protein
VRNPFRSEQDAFRFLLATIAYFVLIVVASIVNKWLGFIVFILLSLAALYYAFGRSREEPAPRVAQPMGGAQAPDVRPAAHPAALRSPRLLSCRLRG